MVHDESTVTSDRANLLGELEHTELQQPRSGPFGAAALPFTATSSSSNRRRSAYARHSVILNQSSTTKRRKHHKRARKKRRKQQSRLANVTPHEGISASILNECIVFINGDNNGTPIKPSIDNNAMNKPIEILSVHKEDLHAPQYHIDDPSKGLILRASGDLSTFVLVPRLVEHVQDMSFGQPFVLTLSLFKQIARTYLSICEDCSCRSHVQPLSSVFSH